MFGMLGVFAEFERRLGQIRARLGQFLVGMSKLPVLVLQRLRPITLRAESPQPQRLRAASDPSLPLPTMPFPAERDVLLLRG